jgi:hypothetical protein
LPGFFFARFSFEEQFFGTGLFSAQRARDHARANAQAIMQRCSTPARSQFHVIFHALSVNSRGANLSHVQRTRILPALSLAQHCQVSTPRDSHRMYGERGVTPKK